MKRTSHLVRCFVFAVSLAYPMASEAAGVSVEAASRSELESAKTPYQDGVKAMNSGEYEQAVAKFRESYNVVASPNSQLMLGRALIKLNRLMDAYRELEQAVKKATELAATQVKYQKTAESAKREMEDLRGELAFVTVLPGTEVILGGRKLSAADWGKPQPMMPGRTKVEIVASDGRTREKNIRLDPGMNKVLTADFSSTSSRVSGAENREKEEAEEREESSSSSSGPLTSRRNLGYIVGGVGVVGVLGFAATALYANSTFGDPRDDCNEQGTSTTRKLCSKTDLGNAEAKGRMMGVSYAMLGVGVLGLGVGTYLIFSKDSSTSASAAPLQMTSVGFGPGSITLKGTF
ncbi:MAG TPA: hypothetical protein VKP30_07765 [Polyangiaceae bacterium]|nr:hypothetical protein [Polyangiaceae bacterium]